MQDTEMGNFQLVVDNKEFNLLPSLKNMGKVASRDDLLTDYDIIHRETSPAWMRLAIARNVFLACSDSQEIDKYLIKINNMKPHLGNKCISINDQIQVAAALMRHGIAGVNCPEYEGSKKARGKTMDSFDVNKIISDARIHLDCTKEEAQNLTMTEFRYLLASKFPVDTAAKNNTPSMGEHNRLMKAMAENK